MGRKRAADVRLCIVDNHEVVREGLRTVLGKNRTIDVVAAAEAALAAVRQVRPDVVLTDFRLPDLPGDELCRRIRSAYRAIAVVVLTTYLSEEVVRQAIDAGGAAFVTKAAGLHELRAALAEVASGGRSLCRGTGALVERLHRLQRPRPPRHPVWPRAGNRCSNWWPRGCRIARSRRGCRSRRRRCGSTLRV